MRPFINKCPWVIQGPKDFIKKLNNVKIPVGFKLWIVNADVVAFYPSIPNKEACSSLMNFFHHVIIPSEKASGNISSNAQQLQFLDYYKRIVSIVLKEPVMTYIDNIFIQHKGIPMGAAGSPDIANVYGYIQEIRWMERFKQNPCLLFYGRYLDNIFTLVLAKMHTMPPNKYPSLILEESTFYGRN